MQSSNRVLGIEGGGTKTEWVLLNAVGDRETVLESGVLAASNLRLTSDAALLQLFSVLPRDVSQVGVFLAGCATDDDRVRLRALAEKAWPRAALCIGSDRDSAMATAFGAADGIAVIAGTGAAVHGRCGAKIEKAGGWGQLLGDLGGGYYLAMQGLRSVLSHYDLTQQITPFAENILRTLALNRLQDLVEWAMQADKMSVARLAPCIFEAARFGEPQMLNVVQAGATILAEFTRAVAQRLDLPAVPVCLVGGLFVHYPDYVSLYKYKLSMLLPQSPVEVCASSGALGAAWLAANPGSAESAGSARARLEIDHSVAPDLEALEALDLEKLDLEELAQAATEQPNPRSGDLEALSSAELVELFVSEESQVAKALDACRPALIRAIDLVSAALLRGGRLFYVGAGTSGRLGVLDASEVPPTFGVSSEWVQAIMAGGVTALYRAAEGAEDQPQAGAFSVLERGVRAGDVVCGLSASGRTPFVLGALAKACELGAQTLLITCNPARRRAERPWDVEIDLPTGPEIVTGSTRLKAGTATKVTLNLLSTAAMIRLGRVRGSAMVDLRVSNAKLRDRALRLVSVTLGMSYEEARVRLESANWDLRACLG